LRWGRRSRKTVFSVKRSRARNAQTTSATATARPTATGIVAPPPDPAAADGLSSGAADASAKPHPLAGGTQRGASEPGAVAAAAVAASGGAATNGAAEGSAFENVPLLDRQVQAASPQHVHASLPYHYYVYNI
jgi:hypothetical protein